MIWAVLGVLASLFAGCSTSGDEQLDQWMREQRSQIRPKVNPIPEPKVFRPQTYTQIGTVEPFSNQRLVTALTREASQAAYSGALIAPELARRKEPLEAFPLDSMAMVGSVLNATGKPIALVRVDNLLYQVRVGNHLGQNYGRVTKITETEVTLREIVQDTAGEWIERAANLQLQERTK
jgi:type IV pilus assembly protein PilP